MAITQQQAQKQILVDLAMFGKSASSFPPVELDQLTEALLTMAARFKSEAQKNLSKADAISTNKLAASIDVQRVYFNGGEYLCDIEVLDRFKFIDQGVNGLEKKHGSPYSFRYKGVSYKMMRSVRKWVIREGLKARSKAVITHQIGAEKKGKPFSQVHKESSDAVAFAVSMNIKKKGIKPTRFWTNAAKTTARAGKQDTQAGFAIGIVTELTRK